MCKLRLGEKPQLWSTWLPLEHFSSYSKRFSLRVNQECHHSIPQLTESFVASFHLSSETILSQAHFLDKETGLGLDPNHKNLFPSSWNNRNQLSMGKVTRVSSKCFCGSLANQITYWHLTKQPLPTYFIVFYFSSTWLYNIHVCTHFFQ